MPLALVMKWLGASRWVPTCSVEVISMPPTPSKATRLIHLMVGPSYRAKPGVLVSQSWDRSRTFKDTGADAGIRCSSFSHIEVRANTDCAQEACRVGGAPDPELVMCAVSPDPDA